MILTRKEVEQLIGESDVMITASLKNPRIKTYLLNYNYDEVRVGEGVGILKNAKDYYQFHIVEGGKQLVATTALEEAIEETKAIYYEHLTIGRLILKNEPEKMVSYSMDGERKQDFNGWVQQGEAFYSSVLNDEVMRAKYAGYGVTPEKLETGVTAIAKVRQNKIDQEDAKSNSQLSTEVRNNAVFILADWIHDLRTILKLALAPEPQLLESAGILARSK
ncbi:MAG: hypothetical protein NT166_14280 [Candidatus Aminicenantes bacterium]|nr:hypothetical protein [Candidatus Aminicenantes bacterium]